MGTMEIQTTIKGNAVVVAVIGRMDTTTTPQYETKLRGLISSGHKYFVVDCTHLGYISSAGLRGILITEEAIKAVGGKIAFANIRDTVKEVFTISGFATIFQICDSVEFALAQVR